MRDDRRQVAKLAEDRRRHLVRVGRGQRAAGGRRDARGLAVQVQPRADRAGHADRDDLHAGTRQAGGRRGLGEAERRVGLGASPNITSTQVLSGRKSIVVGILPSAPIHASGSSPPPPADQALMPVVTAARFAVRLLVDPVANGDDDSSSLYSATANWASGWALWTWLKIAPALVRTFAMLADMPRRVGHQHDVRLGGMGGVSTVLVIVTEPPGRGVGVVRRADTRRTGGRGRGDHGEDGGSGRRRYETMRDRPRVENIVVSLRERAAPLPPSSHGRIAPTRGMTRTHRS